MKELEVPNQVQYKTRVEKKEFDMKTEGEGIMVTREEWNPRRKQENWVEVEP